MQRQPDEAVETDVQVVPVRIGPLIDEFGDALLVARAARQLDRHAAMADAAAMRRDGSFDAELAVDRHPMLMTPEPEHGTGEKLRELLGGFGVPGLETRKILVVTQENDAARVIARRLHDLAQPFHQLWRKVAIRRPEILQEWQADGVVAGVERNDAPMRVLQAEVACRLAPGASVDDRAQRRKHLREIGGAERIHFMIAVEGERAQRTARPATGDIAAARARDAEKILGDLDRIADVVDVAQMDRIVRLEAHDQVGDLRRLDRSSRPVARQRDPYLIVCRHLVDAVGDVTGLVGGKRMPPAHPVLEVLRDEAPEVGGRECPDVGADRLR